MFLLGKTSPNGGWAALHLASYFGQKEVVEGLLKAGVEVNVQNDQGDTPLHLAALSGRKEVVLLLLRYGACATVINGAAQTPRAVTEDDEIITMLEAAERRESRKMEEKLLEAAREGDSSTIAQLFIRNRLPDIHCKDAEGNTPLHIAACRGHRQCVDELLKNGASLTAKNRSGTVLYLCQKWLDAIEEHSAYSARCGRPENTGAEEEHAAEEDTALGDLSDCLQPLTFAQSCIYVYFSSVDYLFVLQVWSVKLEQEVEKNKILSEALQTLATERHRLKQALSKDRESPTPSTLTEDEFYDALTGDYSLHPNPQGIASMSGDGNHGDKAHHNGVKKHSRMSLPAPMFSRNDVSIWSILKKCIGMELSKIAMPVIFNEPLSFLQRLTEYMEHTYLIHQANTSTDSIQRMKCVAAFAVSAVASQWERTGKPFNPLLGETYELIREDLGFRWVSEQVSHHPPVSAFHAEGLKDDFLFHGSIYPKLKFWGKSVEAEPRGIITLELPKHNEAYTWTNPTCCVHNIIVGQLWIEQYGNVEVINHKTGERCSLTFKSCGLFGKELHKVEGYILDKSKKKICAIYGKWTECLYTVDPATFDLHKKADKKSAEEKKGNKQSSVDEEPEEMPPPEAETVQVIPGSELIWRISPRPDNSAQYYAFSTFAMQLNELEDDMKESLPTTDCRLRPDIRALESGDIDLASAEKKRLEEKQRVARKNRSKSSEDWKTRWFHQGPNPHNGGQDWLYSGGYWNRNYSQLPDIY
uniref:Oxysterol-binding protein n=1 Tax=Pygocentrus nattereri TaxID=42514 RepID=A0AAR2KK33_PYGNA